MADQNALENGRIENNVNLLIVKVLLTFFYLLLLIGQTAHSNNIPTMHFRLKSFMLPLSRPEISKMMDCGTFFDIPPLRVTGDILCWTCATCPGYGSGSIMPLTFRHSFVYMYMYHHIKNYVLGGRLFSM